MTDSQKQTQRILAKLECIKALLINGVDLTPEDITKLEKQSKTLFQFTLKLMRATDAKYSDEKAATEKDSAEAE
jgi:hypothetical protein